MADTRHTEVHRSLLGLFTVGTVAGQSDRELLDRFCTQRGEGSEFAFAALVKRHGPMVMRVCSKILDTHDASDAFQATFLVFARKAGSIYCRDTLAPYLHGVALRVASNCRSATTRRRRHERGYASRAGTTYMGKPPDDLGRVVHEELDRLPERFRGVAVLCDLQGMTYAEAAGQLGCPLGTVMSRLAEARRRLRMRLTRRGLAPSAGVLSATLAAEAKAAALPLALSEATIQAVTRIAMTPATAGAVASASVIALTDGVTSAMVVMKLRTLVLLGLVGGMLATKAWVMAQSTQTSPAHTVHVRSIAQSDDQVQPLRKRGVPGMEKANKFVKSNEMRLPGATTKTRLIQNPELPRFANIPGWTWMISPTQFRPDRGGIIRSSVDSYTSIDTIVDATLGGLRTFFVQVAREKPTDGILEFQAVAFDADGGRHPFKQDPVGHKEMNLKGNFWVLHTNFVLDPKVLAPDKVTYFGIEKKLQKPQ